MRRVDEANHLTIRQDSNRYSAVPEKPIEFGGGRVRPVACGGLRLVEIEADSARFEMTIENIPSPENPRSGRITALSAIATLRGLVSPLKVGT